DQGLEMGLGLGRHPGSKKGQQWNRGQLAIFSRAPIHLPPAGPAQQSENAPMRPLPVQPQIDDPMALLQACHNKVRHFTTLIQRLRTHVATHGADAQARDAAVAVRRYFTLAAPLHHDDEDVDLYPALMALGDAALNARIGALSAEHAQLSGLWQGIRPWLDALAQGQMPSGPPPDVDAFALRYRAHAQAEEDEVYPHADRLDAATRLHLAAAMSARRSVSSAPPDAT
ncbi:MAG: hypothetical protein RI920_1257, partial [Pseudomonadota bacterium]